MSKYIEKESLLKYIDNTVFWNSQGDRLLVYLEISDFETADVAPVVHGKWLTDVQEVDGCIKCSICGLELDKYIIGGDMPDYCPKCGAKMDLE